MNSSTAKSSAPKTGICLDCNDHKFDCQCKGGARLATSPAHTAGPWRTDRLEDLRIWILDSKSNYIAQIVTEDDCGFVCPKVQQSANARLIAAAPELLAHLQNIVEMARSVAANWENGNLDIAVRNLDRIAVAAEIAIAKAK